MGEMAVMGKIGDAKVIWDKRNREEVDAARKVFDDLKKKGYLAFRVDTKGDKDTQIHAFDENAEKLIMAPPMRGGA